MKITWFLREDTGIRFFWSWRSSVFDVDNVTPVWADVAAFAVCSFVVDRDHVDCCFLNDHHFKKPGEKMRTWEVIVFQCQLFVKEHVWNKLLILQKAGEKTNHRTDVFQTTQDSKEFEWDTLTTLTGGFRISASSTGKVTADCCGCSVFSAYEHVHISWVWRCKFEKKPYETSGIRPGGLKLLTIGIGSMYYI